jgi:hypothetical protein
LRSTRPPVEAALRDQRHLLLLLVLLLLLLLLLLQTGAVGVQQLRVVRHWPQQQGWRVACVTSGTLAGGDAER